MKPLAPLFLLLFVSCGPANKPSAPPVNSEPQRAAAQPLLDPNAWVLVSETSKMDKSPEVTLFKRAEGSPGGVLTIRCSQRMTELVVVPGEIIDNGVVRIKVDDSLPLRQTWSQATNYQGLFAPEPIALARQLTKTETFLLEYHPFQQGPRTVEFKLAGLATKLPSIADACEWARLDEAKAHAQQVARFEAERALKRESMIREELAKHIKPCLEAIFASKWCWFDEADSYFKNGGAPADTKEDALHDAIQTAKNGIVFQRELAKIDAQLK